MCVPCLFVLARESWRYVGVVSFHIIGPFITRYTHSANARTKSHSRYAHKGTFWRVSAGWRAHSNIGTHEQKKNTFSRCCFFLASYKRNEIYLFSGASTRKCHTFDRAECVEMCVKYSIYKTYPSLEEFLDDVRVA